MPTTGRLGSGPWTVSALDFPASEPPAQQLTFLLRYAVLAPSGHNTQPWLFRVSGDSVELRADRRQALPVVDPSDRELTISCGAALLALRAGLRRFGYRGDAYEVLPDPGDRDLLARVHLVASQAASPAEVALFEAIVRRRTTRAAYDPRPVAAAVQHELEQGVAREGAWLHVVAGGERETIAGLIAEGDRVQMHDRRFRRELASWVHPNRSRATSGMRGDGFGVGDVASLVGPMVIRTFDLGAGQAAKDMDLARHAPMLGVLGTSADGPRAWLAAGQAVGRVSLLAGTHRLTCSYLNQPVEVAELRPRLAAAIGRDAEHPQLVMRFGTGPQTAS